MLAAIGYFDTNLIQENETGDAKPCRCNHALTANMARIRWIRKIRKVNRALWGLSLQ